MGQGRLLRPEGRRDRLVLGSTRPARSTSRTSRCWIPTTGDVTNADKQPLATYNPNDPNSSVDTPGAPPGTAPTWCPSQAGPTCATTFPADFPPGLDLQSLYMGNVSTVGQAKTPSPWGTYDMGGNVVEHTDTLAPQPPGYNFIRDWRYYHGGVANAPAYQVAISAFGYFPGDPQTRTDLSLDGLPRGRHRRPRVRCLRAS